MTQGAAEVGLAAAAGTGDQQILRPLYPVSLSQPCDLASVKVTRVLIVNILYSRAELKARLTDQAGVLIGLAGAFEQKLTVSPSRIHFKP